MTEQTLPEVTGINETDDLLDAQDQENKETGFGKFPPNKIIGFRIVPDDYTWTVFVVKEYGEHSKNAGQEYLNPVAYCRTLESAAQWILARNARQLTESLGLIEAFKAAETNVINAIKDVERRLIDGVIELPRKTRISDRVTLPFIPETIDEIKV